MAISSLLLSFSEEYRELMGKHIPYRDLGHTTLEEFLDHLGVGSFPEHDMNLVLSSKMRHHHLVRRISKDSENEKK